MSMMICMDAAADVGRTHANPDSVMGPTVNGYTIAL